MKHDNLLSATRTKYIETKEYFYSPMDVNICTFDKKTFLICWSHKTDILSLVLQVGQLMPPVEVLASRPFVSRVHHDYKIHRKPRSEVELVAQKVLLSKGPMVTPRIVNSILSGKKPVCQIIEVMELLDREGFGQYCSEIRSTRNPASMRKIFVKKIPDELGYELLLRYGVTLEGYHAMYHSPGRTNL